MITSVCFSKRAEKDLLKIPPFILKKLRLWVFEVERVGLRETQKTPGHHDEPLKGDRHGQRSVRLNRAYRAIYTIKDNGTIEFVLIEEVNKHEY
mgnify:CR=1 FL=1